MTTSREPVEGMNGSRLEISRDVRDMLSDKYFTLSMPRTIFQICLCVVGVFGNMALLLICFRRKNRSSAKVYIGALAAVDLFASAIVIPLQICNSWRYYTFYNEFFCKLFEFFKMATLASSCLLFMAVAVDRYKAICNPFQWRNSSSKRASLVSFSCILTGMALMAPEFVLIGVQEYSVNETVQKFDFTPGELSRIDLNQSCHICEHLNIYDGSWPLSAFLAVTLTIFVLLVIISIVCYSLIARAMSEKQRDFMSNLQNRKSSTDGGAVTSQITKNKHYEIVADKSLEPSAVYEKKHHTVGTLNGGTGTVPTENTPSHGGRDREDSIIVPSNVSVWKKQYSVAKALMTVTIVFVITWLPYWGSNIYGLLYPHFHITSSGRQTAILRFVEQLFFLNNAINPFVYVIYSGEFRMECKQLFHVLRGRRQSIATSSVY